jgi:hypothetical protein
VKGETMTTVSIRFVNSNDPLVHIQVDPWAGLYTLAKGKEIEIVVESETASPEFKIDEYGDTRILTILNSSEYFVVRNGKRVHWTECQADYIG